MEFLNRLFYALTVTHPFHSLTVHFPIALTGAALLFILLALGRRSESLEHAAFYNLALASVSTLVAGLAGLRDNALRYDGAAPNVHLKIALASALLILAAVTTAARWRARDLLWKPSTRALYAMAFVLCFALAATLGFLGGVILYGF